MCDNKHTVQVVVSANVFPHVQTLLSKLKMPSNCLGNKIAVVAMTSRGFLIKFNIEGTSKFQLEVNRVTFLIFFLNQDHRLPEF